MAMSLLACSGASAQPVRVANAAQLADAVKNAKGGEIIQLAAGVYGDVVIDQRDFARPLTIAAAQPGAARIETLQVRGSKNIAFRDLALGRARRPGEPDWMTLHRVNDSSGISFTGVTVHGSDDDDPSNDGYGVTVTNSQGVKFAKSVFRDLWKALMLVGSSDVEVSGSRFTGLREDGINAAGCEDLVIDGNHFEDFRPLAGGHPDAIQLYTAQQQRGQSRIRITNNVILQGKGAGVQGIWIAEPKTYGYRDVVIANNLIHSNDMWNGIGLVGVTGAKVTGNTLVSSDQDEKTLWVRIAESSDVELSNNVFETLRVEPGVTNLRETGNVDLSKPGQAKRRPRKAHGPAAIGDLLVPGVGFVPPGGGA
jgi:nitrous oxidase accessory protein NosD